MKRFERKEQKKQTGRGQERGEKRRGEGEERGGRKVRKR